MILLHCFATGLVSKKAENLAELQDILRNVDPEALLDTEVGYKALKGRRITRTFELLLAPNPAYSSKVVEQPVFTFSTPPIITNCC